MNNEFTTFKSLSWYFMQYTYIPIIILIKYLVSIDYVILLMHYHNNYAGVGKQNQDLHGLRICERRGTV